MLKQGRADEWQIGRARYVDRREGHDAWRGGHVGQSGAIGEVAGAGGEQGNADARDVLGQTQNDRQNSMQQAKHGACKCGDQHAAPEPGAEIDGEPASHGAGDKNAFDA